MLLTAGAIVIDDRGVESKRSTCVTARHTLLQRAGIEVGFVTGPARMSLRHRARELGVNWFIKGSRQSRITIDQGKADY